MVVATRIGAARRWPADRAPNGGRPRLVVTSRQPQNLQSEVNGDLAGLFLICADQPADRRVGIANTTWSPCSSDEEIGLRRAVGARPRHIAAQFLARARRWARSAA